jgi:hypothetical protein
MNSISDKARNTSHSLTLGHLQYLNILFSIVLRTPTLFPKAFAKVHFKVL